MRDKYFLTDLVLTFLLLFFTTFLVKEALAGYWLYFILILTCGFCFSLFFKDRQDQLIRIFITIGTFLALAWMARSILNSSFFYKDVIAICIKGSLIFEIILSFNLCWPKYLNYMQALSLPVFMCFPLVVKGSNEASIIAILGYFICWLVILKVKFYEFLKVPMNEIDFKHKYPIVLPAVIFMISLAVCAALFFKFPFTKAIKGGIFSQKIDTETSQEAIEKEYYDLQEQLQKKITELLPEFGFTEDRYSALTLLSYLIKEAATIMEVDQAQEGLVGYLKTPGAGLEKGEGEETITLLKKFVDKKSGLNLKKIEEEAIKILKESPFNIQARIAIRSLIHKIQNSVSRPQVLEYEKQLQETIDNSSLDATSKGELKKLASQLKEWKILGLRQRNVSYEGRPLEKKKIEDFPVEGAGSRLEKEYLEPPEKYAQIKKASLDIAKILGLFIKITVGGFFLLILCILVLVFILYFLTERQKNKLISSSRDPRVFIINLYENLREVLIIFGARYSEVATPLFYASWVEQRYSIKDNLFLELTEKFEEAKYSQHILASQDGYLALNDYNDSLKAVFTNQNKFILVLKYCLILLHRKPLFL